jgi:hypothetical protein
MEQYKIYSLKDPETNEIRYVGKTISPLYKRLSSHYRDKNISYKTHWINSLKEKGVKPIIKIIEICDENNWEEREKYWISYYREKTRLTNYLNGGQGQQKGYKHTDEAKEKIREAAKKQFKGRFFKGMKFSEEINNKRKDALKKPVFQFSKTGELIKKWDGIIDASETLNIDQNAIQSVLKGKNIFSGGFHWSYNETHNIRKDIKFRAIYVINTITLEKKKFNSIKEASESLQIDRKEIDRGLKRKKEKNNLMFKYV